MKPPNYPLRASTMQSRGGSKLAGSLAKVCDYVRESLSQGKQSERTLQRVDRCVSISRVVRRDYICDLSDVGPILDSPAPNEYQRQKNDRLRGALTPGLTD